MRLLFTTTAGAGHLHPLVPLAQAALEAGHDVAFACPASFRRQVEALGFAALAAGRDGDHDPELRQMWAELARYLERGSLEANGHVVAHVFGRVDTRVMVPDLFPLCADWKPDVIVRDEFEFGGAIVADYRGLPHAAVQITSFRGFPPAWARPLALQLDAVRAAYGLAPDPTLAWLYRHLYLSFDPPSYGDPALPTPPTAQHLRAPRGAPPAGEAQLPWLAERDARPLIYITLGTTFNKTPGVLESIVAGLRDEPYQLVVTIGRDRDPAELGAQPANVRVERYVPHGFLLPHCALVVSHGGHGSILAALREGLPQVLVPIGAEQPFNAARCAAVGAARVIAVEGLTPEVVREEVRTILREPRYRERARRLRAEMEGLPAVEQGIRLLERLVAAGGRPVTPDAEPRSEGFSSW